MKFKEIIGWIGTILILLAYLLVSLKVLTATNILYQLLNFIGALGIIIVSLSKKNYQPAVLNIVWAFIALYALMGIIFLFYF